VSYKGTVINYLYYSDSQIFNELQEMINDMIHSFIVEIVQNAVSVPVIITDSDTSHILAYGNISEKFIPVDEKKSVQNYVQEKMSENVPIQISLNPKTSGLIFYQDSVLISELMYYPLMLLIISVLLALIAYFTLRSFEKHEKENYDSFLDMLYGKFGVSITEKFLKPYNEKLYACNLNLLDVEAMGRFFPYANLNEIIQNMRKSNNDSYNNDFLYPKEGAAVFVRHLLNGLNPDLVHLGEEVRSIDIDQKTVVTESNTYHYDYLISSLPLNSFIRLIGKENLLEEHPLSFNQVLVLNLGFDKPSIDRDIHWIYIPSPDTNFYRAGFYNNIIGSEKLSMYIEIGYGMEEIITSEIIEQQLEQTLDNLHRIGIIQDHKLVDWQALVMSPAYVHITKDSNQFVKQLMNELSEHQIYTIGRYGQWKYCSIEDCMVDAAEVSKRI